MFVSLPPELRVVEALLHAGELEKYCNFVVWPRGVDLLIHAHCHGTQRLVLLRLQLLLLLRGPCWLEQLPTYALTRVAKVDTMLELLEGVVRGQGRIGAEENGSGG